MGIVAAALFLLQAQDEDTVQCKMKKLEDGFYCETDDFLLEKTEKDGTCWKCKKKPLAVKLCVIDYYRCAGCGEKNLQQIDCCAGKMVKKTSKVRVIHRCAGCGATAHQSKNCSDSKCDRNGQKYVAVCEKSGTFPHGNRDQ